MSDRPIIGVTVGTPFNPDNLGGDSNIDIVTEFEGIDIVYDPRQVYNANLVNELFTQFLEHLETFATTEYVNELIGGIENGSY